MAFDLALEGKVRRIPVDTRGSNTNGGRGQKVGPIDRGVRRSIYVFA